MVIKPRGVNLGKKWKNPSGEVLYLSFAITRLKVGLAKKNAEMRKTTSFFAQNGFPSIREPPGTYLIFPNQCATPIKLQLQNRNLFCKKKIKFANRLDQGFFLHFRIPGITKRVFRDKKKSRFFEKLIIKNVQNELLYINLVNLCNNNLKKLHISKFSQKFV